VLRVPDTAARNREAKLEVPDTSEPMRARTYAKPGRVEDYCAARCPCRNLCTLLHGSVGTFARAGGLGRGRGVVSLIAPVNWTPAQTAITPNSNARTTISPVSKIPFMIIPKM
jgi:hypothetical protein